MFTQQFVGVHAAETADKTCLCSAYGHVHSEPTLMWQLIEFTVDAHVPPTRLPAT